MLSYPIQSTKHSFLVSSTVKLILEAAKELDIDYEFIEDTRLIRFSYQGHEEFLVGQRSSHLSFIASHCVDDKFMARALLERANVSVAKGFRCDNLETLPELLKQITFPVVCKPYDGAHGLHVFANLGSLQSVMAAADIILKDSDFFLVEEMFQGKEYRITLNEDSVLGITERVPANIIGDGQHTIKELIEKKNKDPHRGANGDYTLPLFAIEINEQLCEYLLKAHLALDSVPFPSQKIALSSVSNLSQGGDSLDVTDKAHPSVKMLAKRALAAVPGLVFAGVDFMTTDIAAEQTASSYIILEINASPGFDMHDIPFKGKNRHVAEAFLRQLFPECP